MPKADNAGKAGANAGANDAADKSTDDATGKKAGDNQNDDNGGQTGGGEKPAKEGKTYTDDEINEIVQRRLKRATKDADEKAQLSKEQLLEKERDDARNELRISNARDSFITKTGIPYAKASRLFKMYSGELEFDDAGKVENMADVLKTVKAEWPEYFKNTPDGSADLGDGNGDSGKKTAGGMNDILRGWKTRK
jgi:hypothetical protein